MRDPSRLCVLSRHFCRRGAGHRGCGAFTARILTPRRILGIPVCARRLFGEFHGARVLVGEADAATRRRELRH